MSRPRINPAQRALAGAVLFGALLAGCSDPGLYFDRRDTIILGGGDSVAANEVEQMADPWPRNSNNKNLTFNGDRMQRAVQCYRIDKVTPPADLDPSTQSVAPTVGAGTMCAGQMTNGSAQPAADTAIAGASAAGTHD
jgi:hypothetical protein